MNYSIVLNSSIRMVTMFALLSLSIGSVSADCDLTKVLNHDAGTRHPMCTGWPHFSHSGNSVRACINCLGSLWVDCASMGHPMSQEQFDTEEAKCRGLQAGQKLKNMKF
jgi:hypothetical protein